MPGLIDCHTHHNGFGDGRKGEEVAALPDEILTLQAARNATACLFSGVTSLVASWREEDGDGENLSIVRT